ncbi:V-type ATPase subunit [Tuanshanicoccus lijuaniae]|uniref:V-type ATPase subunit n=1 Tax=Aerococcaceae bacterium zg-1292 TaxID=2774330 RepID=UPI001935F76C|nr:V-type ATPase subunit [Aerococcaceae bacterium zg-1292]QQA37461.1 V-type ATPase subunit [Aerococcaceae bacterium zg-1292]
MTTHDFSSVNTTISIREKDFLTADEWQQLLDAKDAAAVALILQNTPYEMSVEQLEDPDAIESVLMTELRRTYRLLFDLSPQSEVIELFSSIYTYHNLKVLMKNRATGRDLSALLIPIGRFSIDALEHLVNNLESTIVYPSLVEEVRRTWSEYEAYQLTDAIDVGFDGAYFAHLRMLEERIDDECVEPIVNALVDFYNVIAVKRAMELDKGRSFMHTMMTSRGSVEKQDLIDAIENNELSNWFDAQDDIYYGPVFQKALKAMNDGTITASQLEKLKDDYLHQFLYEKRLESDGPLALLRYLVGKETEIRNLRLVLTGRVNGLQREQITERMGAIYGETI